MNKPTLQIIRENNLYNKSMRWHLVIVSNNGMGSSWFKTLQEARNEALRLNSDTFPNHKDTYTVLPTILTINN